MYYVTVKQRLFDGTEAVSILGYSTEMEALAKGYAELNYACIADTIQAVFVTYLNNELNQYKHDELIKPDPEPEEV